MLNKKALAATAAAQALYVEDVFSTYLYTGNGSTLTINNGIDLSGEGGLTWFKQRNLGRDHVLQDTVRGAGNAIFSNLTNAQSSSFGGVSSYGSTGFTLDGNASEVNNNNDTYASWTFRKAEKFFDVVTWTGNGTGTRNIAHALASTPGAIFIKQTSSNTSWINWYVYHRANTGTPETAALFLNTTDATAQPNGYLASTAPTSTQFTVTSGLNESSKTYVAYLFAHNAGGFGDSGTDNVVSCGSFTRTFGTANSVNLGYEPQWVLIKCTSQTDSWQLYDTMRGLNQTQSLKLEPNSANPDSDTAGMIPTATGFDITATGVGGGTFIYIAIRRGPMKTPEAGTSVFEPLARSGTGAAATVTTTVRPDGVLQNWRSGGLGSASHFFYDRLRGVAKALFTDTTDAESTQTATGINAFNNLSYGIAGAGSMNNGSATYVDYIFTRAPGFFDIVCYTGNGTSGRTVTHNLGTKPQLIIVKCRNDVGHWYVYNETITATKYLAISLDNAAAAFTGAWNDTEPTSSVFSLGNVAAVNGGSNTFVAYLFASVAGVSKVGSYTGNGSSQTINCGFTGGSRFVLIKRTDSTGDWVVFDSARGIVSGNDPALYLNSTAAEVTTADAIDTDNTGFVVNQESTLNVNVNNATYIYLAIA